jgi:hypothetical protein
MEILTAAEESMNRATELLLGDPNSHFIGYVDGVARLSMSNETGVILGVGDPLHPLVHFRLGNPRIRHSSNNKNKIFSPSCRFDSAFFQNDSCARVCVWQGFANPNGIYFEYVFEDTVLPASACQMLTKGPQQEGRKEICATEGPAQAPVNVRALSSPAVPCGGGKTER